MRLFVAIPLPDKVKQELQKLQQPVDGIRWQASEQFHLTLRFIGDVEQQTTKVIQQQLELIRCAPFHVNIHGLGYFPAKRHPRVIWVGVEKGPPLMKLQQKVEEACRNVGLEPERRKYIPHITIGKVKGASGQLVRSFIDRHDSFDADQIHVSELMLYSSHLRPDGAVHTPEERYLLMRNE